jgi:predicted Rossmann-fold nucleotide-binding protein
MIIAVIGGNISSAPSVQALSQAKAVGAEIARLGHVLICGGQAARSSPSPKSERGTEGVR